MYNYNSPIIQNMIQTGQLQQQQEYNPYSGGGVPQQQLPYQPQPQYCNNMIPFGYNGYNQQQYYPYQNNYGYQQPQEQNGYIFKPVAGGYDYGYNQQSQQYYNFQNNFYGNTQLPQQYYGDYNQYNDPFLYTTMDQNGNVLFYQGQVQASQIAEAQKNQIEMEKLKARQVAKYFNKEVDEDALDRRFNPNHPDNKKRTQEYYSPELAELKRMQQIVDLIDHPIMETEAMKTARLINEMSANFHKEYDGMGLCEFLEDHLWKFQREWWIRDNINFKSSRDLSGTYNNGSYMDLLNMHRSSNPYINDLLNTSKYDNNLDDSEIGLPSVLIEAERRRKQMLEGPVPQFISSSETQKQRHEFFNQLTNLVNAKKQGVMV